MEIKKIIVGLFLYLFVVVPSVAITFPDTAPYNPGKVQGPFRIEVFELNSSGQAGISVYKWSFRSTGEQARGTLHLERKKAYFVRIMGNNTIGRERFDIDQQFFQSGDHATNIITEPFLHGNFTSSRDINFFTKRVRFSGNDRNRFVLKGNWAGYNFNLIIPYKIIN